MSALDGLEDRDLSAVSLGGGGRWILLEPGPGPLDDSFEDAVHRLHDRGFRALIAHPERHGSNDLLERLGRLIASGALVQATAAFFTEQPNRSGMLALAGAGAIHVLGSDAHSSRAGRPVALTPALDALARVPAIAEHLVWIAQTAPRAIVAGAELTPPYPVVPK
jgi:tyrosine-protein phosphatase YwqE